MHLRVPSGTSIPLVAVRTCACKMDVAGVINARIAASIVRLEACVHICVLIEVASKSGFEENSQATRFFNDFRASVEPYFE